jgi:hypothetical protein
VSRKITYAYLKLIKHISGNTNRGNFELFGAVSACEGEGISVPLAFCFITTSKEASKGAKHRVLRRFLTRLKEHGVNPEYTLSDKDWSEIKALKQVWPKAKHLLCLWHVLRAVKQRLAKLRTQPAPYDAEAAHSEFDYIDLSFVPEGQLDELVKVHGHTYFTQCNLIAHEQVEPPPVAPLPRIIFLQDGRPQILTPALTKLRIPPLRRDETAPAAAVDAEALHAAAAPSGSSAPCSGEPASSGSSAACAGKPGPSDSSATCSGEPAPAIPCDADGDAPAGLVCVEEEGWSETGSDLDEDDARRDLRDLLEEGGQYDDVNDEIERDVDSEDEAEGAEHDDSDEEEGSGLEDEDSPAVNRRRRPARSRARAKPRPAYAFCPLAHRAAILRLVTKHAALHPLLPERHGQPRTSLQIYADAVYETYHHCWRNHLREVWAYLWNAWYCPERWPLWTRSSRGETLSTRRTTMMVEAMWRNFKRLALHMYNRPPVDLAAYAIITKAIPPYRLTLAKLLNDLRAGRPPLPTHEQAAFKRSFDRLCAAKINRSSYATNVATWTCDCGAQKYHAQVSCKHLVQAADLPKPDFWVTTRRYYCPPFYTVPQVDGTISAPPDDRRWWNRPLHATREALVVDSEDDELPQVRPGAISLRSHLLNAS